MKGGNPMENIEIKKGTIPHILKTGNTRWCGLERVVQESDGNQQCYYCNFSLECGQQECIWREDGDDA